jgi:hypothetical protein
VPPLPKKHLPHLPQRKRWQRSLPENLSQRFPNLVHPLHLEIAYLLVPLLES